MPPSYHLCCQLSEQEETTPRIYSRDNKLEEGQEGRSSGCIEEQGIGEEGATRWKEARGGWMKEKLGKEMVDVGMKLYDKQ